MTLTFNPTVYIDLLAQTMPSSIESDAEYQRLLAITEALHFKDLKYPLVCLSDICGYFRNMPTVACRVSL